MVGRPHIARALAQADVVAAPGDAFSPEWIGTGGRAHVTRYALDPARAIALVRAAGGVSVLAHPRGVGRGWDMPDDMIAALAAAGLTGLEVNHPQHDEQQRQELTALAAALDLIPSGGSDDHGELTGYRIGTETAPGDSYRAAGRAGDRCDAGPRLTGAGMSGFFPFKFFWEVFITLLVITDPPGVVPVFLGLTRERPAAQRNRLAWQAAVVAFGVIVAFALFGRSVLTYLGVELPALQVAGGLLLLLVALQLLTGQGTDQAELDQVKANVAFVPLGTPLLAGPGAIVATMLFVQRTHTFGEGLAFAIALLAVTAALWLAMRFSGAIQRVLHDSGVELLTRIAGLLLSAIAVQLVIGAVRTIVLQS